MLNVINEVVTSKDVLFDLWKHECCRVISDRFVNEQDTAWFLKCLKNTVEEDFGQEQSSAMQDEPYFVDFLRDAPELTGVYSIHIRLNSSLERILNSSTPL